jgi:hypothetical protein
VFLNALEWEKSNDGRSDARRTDERGYPIPLPEPLRTRLVAMWVLAAAAAGASLTEYMVAGGDSATWQVAAFVVFGFVPGTAAGLALAAKERGVALPTSVAAGLVALLVALAAFLVLAVLVVVGMALSHTGT